MTNKVKIKSILDKINWLFKSIEENNFENISALEKSLLKEKVLLFYDEIENLGTTVLKESLERPVSKEIPVIIEKKEETVIVEQEKAKEAVVEEIKVVDEKPIVGKTAIPEIEEPIVETTTPTIETKIDTEKSKKEQFEKTEEFQRQIVMPKRDMREIIDLNKSFIFKAELFSQNNDLYNQFINEMNTTRNENDAFEVLINWTEKLNWETEENKAYDLLLRSIEKRFLPLI